MKHNTPGSLKFIKLKRRLQLPHYAVVGLLESLWIFTQVNAATGAIGTHSNEDIAACLEWAGDPDKLIVDLVECGWVDRCQVHRLVIHDWAEHCPTYIRGQLKSQGKTAAKSQQGEPPPYSPPTT